MLFYTETLPSIKWSVQPNWEPRIVKKKEKSKCPYQLVICHTNYNSISIMCLVILIKTTCTLNTEYSIQFVNTHFTLQRIQLRHQIIINRIIETVTLCLLNESWYIRNTIWIQWMVWCVAISFHDFFEFFFLFFSLYSVDVIVFCIQWFSRNLWQTSEIFQLSSSSC